MDSGDLEFLRYTRDGHVGRLVLHRPDRLNAFTPAMWAELRAFGRGLVGDPDVRALVVSGEGRAFSSGIDTAVFSGAEGGLQFGSDEPPRHDDPIADTIMRAQESYSWLAEAPFVTIAAVHGYALGAGLQLALACDLRVFTRSVDVGILELRYGIMPDLGGTQRLPRLVGPGKAKELILTGARIDGEEAHRIGLCERVVDDDALDAEVATLAALLAAQPPLAVRGVKRAVDAVDLPIAEGLRVEAEGQAVCLPSQDMKEAIAAFVEQRPPRYEGR